MPERICPFGVKSVEMSKRYGVTIAMLAVAFAWATGRIDAEPGSAQR